MAVKIVDPIEELKAFVSRYPTQKAAAEALGISQGFLSDMLQGSRDVSARIREHLNIELVAIRKSKEVA